MRELHGADKEDLPTKEMMNTNQIDFDSFLPVLPTFPNSHQLVPKKTSSKV